MENVATQNTPSVADITFPRKVKVITSRWGGFSISHADALAWANRIRAEDNQPPLTDAPEHSGAIMHTVEDVVEATGGIGCFPHGSIVSGRPYESYLILTKYEQGEWVRIDGMMQHEWYFTEGEDEELAKRLLKQQGIPHGPFETCFASLQTQ